MTEVPETPETPEAPEIIETPVTPETPEEVEIPEEKETIPIFEEELARITRAIEVFDQKGPSHIAIIANPFAGQSMLFKMIEDQFPERVVRLSFYNVVKEKGFLSQTYGKQDIVLIERCHFLALRRIGGFEMLDAFLDVLATSNKLFITGWNTFSWSYLSAVKHIETFFPEVLPLPKIESQTLKNLILSEYEEVISFVDDTEKKEEPFIQIIPVEITLPITKKSIPLRWFKFRRTTNHRETRSPEDVAFEKIATIAMGNYGVAKRLWERSLEDSILKFSQIPDVPCTISLGINESFVINIILSMESINKTDLAEIAGPEINVEQVLYQLINLNLVEEEREFYQITPEALNCVISYLKRIRMVW